MVVPGVSGLSHSQHDVLVSTTESQYGDTHEQAGASSEQSQLEQALRTTNKSDELEKELPANLAASFFSPVKIRSSCCCRGSALLCNATSTRPRKSRLN